jgi:hypothetical protein
VVAGTEGSVEGTVVSTSSLLEEFDEHDASTTVIATHKEMKRRIIFTLGGS